MGSGKMNSLAVYALFEELKKIDELSQRARHNTNSQTIQLLIQKCKYHLLKIHKSTVGKKKAGWFHLGFNFSVSKKNTAYSFQFI